jgi:UDP-2,4-diacetamido-2,4,6-trideoxy-beta-L-altropyranose hydrolase
MRNIFIRADSTAQIGAGHLMRCLALAQAWQDEGGEATFISHCESDQIKQRILDEGFDFVPIEKPYPNPKDLSVTLKLLSAISYQLSTANLWFVIDGYHFDAAYQKQIKDEGYRLLWIGDYGQADHYYADLVLNQNISADESLYIHREPYTRLLLGTRYVLLRREFKKWRGWRREIPVVARKVLVTLGGGDPDNVTLKVIKALKQVNISDLEARIIVGPANPNLQTLLQEIGDHSNLEIITNAANMPELMAWADIAVSAGGSTCWELALMGLPSMIIYFAENQQPIAERLDEIGASLSLRWNDALTFENIAEAMADLLLSQENRRKSSKKLQDLIDGSGAQRVCEKLM